MGETAGRRAYRVFMTKAFARFASRESIETRVLCEAVDRADRGLIDAELGAGVIKQRLARKGQGKSGGYRSIVLYRRADLAIFVHGFAKRDRDNLDRDELLAFRKLASSMLNLDRNSLSALSAKGAIKEIDCNDQGLQERRHGSGARDRG